MRHGRGGGIEPQSLLRDILSQSFAETREPAIQTADLRFPLGKQLIEITVFEKLFLALGKQLLGKLPAVCLCPPLLPDIQEVHKIVQRLDPSDHFPIGQVLGFHTAAEELHGIRRKGKLRGQLRIVVLQLPAEFLEQLPHGQSKFTIQRDERWRIK